MKTKLTFEFDDDDGVDEPKIYIHAKDVNSAIWDLKQAIRSKLKHGHEFKTPDDVLEWVQEELFNIKGVEE
jgi:hypothetical protein